jgi:hypothetical protein
VNDESYSNFMEVHTYPFSDISRIPLNIIHGVHSRYQITVETDKNYDKNLPDYMMLQIDDDFFDCFKIPESLNTPRVTY